MTQKEKLLKNGSVVSSFRKCILLVVYFLFANAIYASPPHNSKIRHFEHYFFQQKPIKGKVVNSNGAPLVGATVKIKGTDKSFSTDPDGFFSFEITDKDAILVISYVGMATKEVQVKHNTD